jgi:hypothetical protein
VEQFGIVPERGIVDHRSDWASFVRDAGHGLVGRLLRDIDASSGRAEIAAALFVVDEQAERRIVERAAKARLFLLERRRFGRLTELHAPKPRTRSSRLLTTSHDHPAPAEDSTAAHA